MRGGGRLWTVLVGVTLLVVLSGYAFTAPSASAGKGDLPCPDITPRSPQTRSTNPPPVVLNPCPGVIMGTFLGGSNADYASDVAVDTAGNSYITGDTKSPDFPTTFGA